MGGKGSGKKPTIGIDDEPERPETDVKDELHPIDEVISGLLDLEKDSTAYLYRLWPPMPELPTDMPRYISQFKGPFELDDIQKKHGGGVYRLRIKRVGRSGKLAYNTFRFAIEGDAIMPKIEAADKPQIDSDIISRLDKLEGMITAMAMKTSGNNQPTMVEKLQELQLMKEILSGDGKQLEPMIGLFTKGIEIAKDMSGGDDWSSVIKDLAPEFIKLLQQRRAPLIVRKKAPIPGTADAGPSQESQVSQPTDEKAENTDATLIEILSDIVRDGLQNEDRPETVARTISKMLAEEEYTALVKLDDEQIDAFCIAYLKDNPGSKEYVNKILETLKKER